MVDRLFQAAYRLAYRTLRLYWALRHPKTHGALVVAWHRGRILLIRTSYLDVHTAPGGAVRRDESARHAAARELAEEVGIVVPENRLTPVFELTHYWDHKHDHVHLYRLDLSEEPALRVDNREVVEAGFYSPGLALALDLFPPVRRHLELTLGPERPTGKRCPNEQSPGTGSHPQPDAPRPTGCS